MTDENPRNDALAKRAGKDWQTVNDEVLGRSSNNKSYYAPSVEDAMTQARTEMGPEAILVRSRRSPLELRHLGSYEVIFSLPSNDIRPRSDGRNHAEPSRSAPGRSTALSSSEDRLSVEMAEMRRQMQEIQRALTSRPLPQPPSDRVGLAQQAMEERLRQLELDEEVVAPLAAAASMELAAQLAPAGETPDRGLTEAQHRLTDRILRAELMQQLRVAPAASGRGSTASVTAVIGPPGAGKTASLVKMAMLRSHTATRPIHFISTDSYRVGAAEQLRTYASILGAGIDLVDSPRMLGQAIEANLGREAILIDTPGLSGDDFEMLNELAEFLGRRSDIEKHLVLPATMRFRDLQRSIRRFEQFQPDRLLFTRLDETDCFGPLWSAALWCRRPLSFLSGGQQIPEDLEPATETKLSDLLFGTNSRAMESGLVC
jgi:flagellar biosynthesis protein FlhF